MTAVRDQANTSMFSGTILQADNNFSPWEAIRALYRLLLEWLRWNWHISLVYLIWEDRISEHVHISLAHIYKHTHLSTHTNYEFISSRGREYMAVEIH